MDRTQRPITIAIQAMGGQGGGVLADWIVGVAEAHGYLAQTTSIPGVAQRTGTTIYYLEIFPGEAARKAGKAPVLALMPSQGDVDLVVGAELMEAVRAVKRGLVTPNRTTLIASTHRVYAIFEKEQMGDGILENTKAIEIAEKAAQKFVYFDMQRVAELCGSVISAVLLGAVAASGCLPFDRSAFEDAIRRGGIGVDASLKAFAKGFDQTQKGSEAPSKTKPARPEPNPTDERLKRVLKDAGTRYPQVSHFFVVEGMRRCSDYLDPRYAEEYVKRLDAVLECDKRNGGEDRAYTLTNETARYLALWMSYEDTIRVADLKIRSSRFQRFRDDVHAQDGQVVYVTEFMHPRIEEICDTMPVWLGAAIMHSRLLQLPFKPFLKARKVRTATILGFSMLWVVSRMRRWKRSTYRYKVEMERIQEWLDRVQKTAATDYALAVEIVRCQRLIKGYSDTHARGLRNYQRIMKMIDGYRGPEVPAEVVRRLRNAALADEEGGKLEAEVAGLQGNKATNNAIGSPAA